LQIFADTVLATDDATARANLALDRSNGHNA
jgi:hypothetical protein